MLFSDLRYRIGVARRDRARAAFYRQFVRPADLAFDVGAHVGDRTALLLKAGARVVAVEPHPQLQEKLTRLFGGNARVTLVAEAVGAEPGTAELRWPRGGLALASMSDEWIDRVRGSGRFGADWTDHATVPVTTLDALVERHGMPTFCKIDVEGYEEVVVRGMTTPIPIVSIEFTPEYLDSAERTLVLLGELGDYRFNYAVGETLSLAEPRWLTRVELLDRLRTVGRRSFGDIYARVAV